MIARLRLRSLGLQDVVMDVNPFDAGISCDLVKNGLREPLNSFFISWFCKKYAPDVVDIGGNIGYFPLIELASGCSSVTVFEPVMETYSFLVNNLSGYFNVQCFNNAVGGNDFDGRIAVFTKKNLSSLVPSGDWIHRLGSEFVYDQDVKVLSLKSAVDVSMVGSFGGMLRMDIEGYELDVLREIPECISFVNLEFHVPVFGFDKAMKFIDDMDKQGFELVLLTRELDGYVGLFRWFGIKILEFYSKFVSKRIFVNPSRDELVKVFSYASECPHLFFVRKSLKKNVVDYLLGDDYLVKEF